MDDRLTADGKVETIKAWRLKRKMKQADVAKALGISQPMYNRYETDSTKPIPEIYWDKIATTLDVSVQKIKALSEERQVIQKLTDSPVYDTLDLSHLPSFVSNFILDPHNKETVVEALLAYMIKERKGEN